MKAGHGGHRWEFRGSPSGSMLMGDQVENRCEACLARVPELVEASARYRLADIKSTSAGLSVAKRVATLTNNRMIDPLHEDLIHRAVEAVLDGLTPRG